MVPDHGFARVGTMQVQAVMPPLICFCGGGGWQDRAKRTSCVAMPVLGSWKPEIEVVGDFGT